MTSSFPARKLTSALLLFDLLNRAYDTFQTTRFNKILDFAWERIHTPTLLLKIQQSNSQLNSTHKVYWLTWLSITVKQPAIVSFLSASWKALLKNQLSSPCAAMPKVSTWCQDCRCIYVVFSLIPVVSHSYWNWKSQCLNWKGPVMSESDYACAVPSPFQGGGYCSYRLFAKLPPGQPAWWPNRWHGSHGSAENTPSPNHCCPAIPWLRVIYIVLLFVAVVVFQPGMQNKPCNRRIFSVSEVELTFQKEAVL